LRALETGFFVPGQARDIQRIGTPSASLYLVARNNERALIFRSARNK
jgi:hypothetical protein